MSNDTNDNIMIADTSAEDRPQTAPSWQTLRGTTAECVVCDEVFFFNDLETATPGVASL